eukprot:gene10292-7194_t
MLPSSFGVLCLYANRRVLGCIFTQSLYAVWANRGQNGRVGMLPTHQTLIPGFNLLTERPNPYVSSTGQGFFGFPP